MNKHFQLKLEQIKCLVEGCGACFTTDKITVEGNPIRFMYREYPDNAVDGGWYFMSGLESDEYMNNANNMVVYDVNTLAHCDGSIVLWFYRQRL